MKSINIPGVSIIWKYGQDLNPTSLTPDEAKIADSISHPEKKNEFTLGRQALKEALANSGIASPLSLGRREGGEPILPQGYCGSISHTESTAFAAAASTRDFRSIGVDVERVNRGLGDKILKRVARDNEAAWINKLDSNERTLMLVSAKEALFKMLYPLSKVFFGMLDAELSWQGEGFIASLKKDLSADFKIGSEYQIKSYKVDDFIVSIGTLAV